VSSTVTFFIIFCIFCYGPAAGSVALRSDGHRLHLPSLQQGDGFDIPAGALLVCQVLIGFGAVASLRLLLRRVCVALTSDGHRLHFPSFQQGDGFDIPAGALLVCQGRIGYGAVASLRLIPRRFWSKQAYISQRDAQRRGVVEVRCLIRSRYEQGRLFPYWNSFSRC
jgi:hypothetical protein